MRELQLNIELGKFKYKTGLNPEIIDFIKRLLEPNPDLRINCDQILELPLMAKNAERFNKPILLEEKRAVIQNYINSTSFDKFRETPANILNFKRNDQILIEKKDNNFIVEVDKIEGLVNVVPGQLKTISISGNKMENKSAFLNIETKTSFEKSIFDAKNEVLGNKNELLETIKFKKSIFDGVKPWENQLFSQFESKEANIFNKTTENNLIQKEDLKIVQKNNVCGLLLPISPTSLNKNDDNLYKCYENITDNAKKNINIFEKRTAPSIEPEKRVIFIESGKTKVRSILSVKPGTNKPDYSDLQMINVYDKKMPEFESNPLQKNNQIPFKMLYQQTYDPEMNSKKEAKKEATNNNKVNYIKLFAEKKKQEIDTLIPNKLPPKKIGKNSSKTINEELNKSKNNTIDSKQIKNNQKQFNVTPIKMTPQNFIFPKEIINNNLNVNSEKNNFENNLNTKLQTESILQTNFLNKSINEETRKFSIKNPLIDVPPTRNNRGIDVKVISRERSVQKRPEFKTLDETIKIPKSKQQLNIFGYDL